LIWDNQLGSDGNNRHLRFDRWRMQFNRGIAAWLLDHPIRSAPLFHTRPSQPKQHWNFHQPERQLTTRRAADIAPI
jgi:hypothetical protein